LAKHSCFGKIQLGFWRNILVLAKSNLGFGETFLFWQNPTWVLAKHSCFSKIQLGFWRNIPVLAKSNLGFGETFLFLQIVHYKININRIKKTYISNKNVYLCGVIK